VDLFQTLVRLFTFENNPETKKLERMKNVYGKANLENKEAVCVLSVTEKSTTTFFKEGYNSFEDNRHLHKTKKEQIIPEIRRQSFCKPIEAPLPKVLKK